MIKHLSENHSVTVVSLVRSEAEAEEADGIMPFCSRFEPIRVFDPFQKIRMVLRIPTLEPSSFGFFTSNSMRSMVENLLKREVFDLIFVHCSSVAEYIPKWCKTPVVLDFGDMDSEKWASYSQFKPFPLNVGYWLEAKKLKRREKQLAKWADLSTCTTKAELETLESYKSAQMTAWFPNGVDYTYFSPDSEVEFDKNKLVFIGRMDYYPNQSAMQYFCRKVMPKLREKHPDITLSIVGAEPSKAILKLAELKGVEVTGTVDDVRPYVRGALAMVAPLNIARGTQNKLLEAMAMQVPVITTSEAVGGVDAVPGEHLLVADNVDEWVKSIDQLRTDLDYRNELAKLGRERVVSHHDWQHSMQRFDQILADFHPRYAKEQKARSKDSSAKMTTDNIKTSDGSAKDAEAKESSLSE